MLSIIITTLTSYLDHIYDIGYTHYLPELSAVWVDPHVGSGPDFCKFRRVGSGQEI
jgi:hypothetical protein